jgi:hypothetical protein
MHEYSFTWTPAEYVRACHAITRHVRGAASPLLMFVVFALIGFVAIPFATGTPYASVLMFSIVAFVLLLAAYSYWGAPWLRARRVLREDPCANEAVRHIVSADGFSVRTRSVAVDVKWDHISQVVETPEFILVYFSKRAAYFTPKRVIPDANIQPLRTFFRQTLGERAHLSGSSAAAA